MCIKCGCGKKAGQPGYGMGKPKTRTPVKNTAKRVAKKQTMVRKKGM
jgi:hypothetical protein